MMPTYEAVCLKCGKYHEYVRTFASYLDTPECCGEKTSKRILVAPTAHCDIAPWEAFESPATGKIITSKAERRADMKASGCREWEGLESERKEAEQSKKYDEEAQDKALDHTVRTAWANLSPTKKAQALAEAS